MIVEILKTKNIILMHFLNLIIKRRNKKQGKMKMMMKKLLGMKLERIQFQRNVHFRILNLLTQYTKKQIKISLLKVLHILKLKNLLMTNNSTSKDNHLTVYVKLRFVMMMDNITTTLTTKLI